MFTYVFETKILYIITKHALQYEILKYCKKCFYKSKKSNFMALYNFLNEYKTVCLRFGGKIYLIIWLIGLMKKNVFTAIKSSMAL